MITAKRQSVITLILFCICAPVLSAEPNEAGAALKFGAGEEPNQPKTELKFEISREKKQWIVEPMNEIGKGPIKPTHVAVLLIESERIPIIYWNDISNSRVGQTMSQEQHDFLKQGQVRYIRHKGAYREFHWYAVSEDDARKMPQAFLEAWTNKVNPKLKDLLDEQQELEEKIPKVKKKFEEKLTGLQTTWDKLREKFKGGPHSLKDYNEPVLGLEAVNEAKETIKEMYKKLDTINVEIEGIKAKLLAIE